MNTTTVFFKKCIKYIVEKINNTISTIHTRRIIVKMGGCGTNINFSKDIKLLNPDSLFVGDDCSIGRGSVINIYKEYSGDVYDSKVIIGNRSGAREFLTILCVGNVIIGNNVTFAGHILITSENHGLDPRTSNYLDNPLEHNDVVVSDGVWVGERTMILPGVTIGEKTVIGAGSVVTHSLPSYCIAAGNPCRVIKRWNGEFWVKMKEQVDEEN